MTLTRKTSSTRIEFTAEQALSTESRLTALETKWAIFMWAVRILTFIVGSIIVAFLKPSVFG